MVLETHMVKFFSVAVLSFFLLFSPSLAHGLTVENGEYHCDSGGNKIGILNPERTYFNVFTDCNGSLPTHYVTSGWSVLEIDFPGDPDPMLQVPIDYVLNNYLGNGYLSQGTTAPIISPEFFSALVESSSWLLNFGMFTDFFSIVTSSYETLLAFILQVIVIFFLARWFDRWLKRLSRG